MFRIIETLVGKAKGTEIRVPPDVYGLIDSVRTRYTNFDLYGDRFLDLSEREKLQNLINVMNQDLEIPRLSTLAHIGLLMESVVGEKTTFGGFGTNLCVGPKGLYVYKWNDYNGEYREIPASPESLQMVGRTRAEDLRSAVVRITNKRNYVQYIRTFKIVFQ